MTFGLACLRYRDDGHGRRRGFDIARFGAEVFSAVAPDKPT